MYKKADTVKLDLSKKETSKPLTITRKPSLGTMKPVADKTSFLTAKTPKDEPVKKEEAKPVISSFTSRLSMGLLNPTVAKPSTATHPDRRNAVRSPNKDK